MAIQPKSDAAKPYWSETTINNIAKSVAWVGVGCVPYGVLKLTEGLVPKEYKKSVETAEIGTIMIALVGALYQGKDALDYATKPILEDRVAAYIKPCLHYVLNGDKTALDGIIDMNKVWNVVSQPFGYTLFKNEDEKFDSPSEEVVKEVISEVAKSPVSVDTIDALPKQVSDAEVTSNSVVPPAQEKKGWLW